MNALPERMVSYAQNFEDVMLRRAFGDQPTGFYIDVGAYHDSVHSVTRHFYAKGWRGINVEPVEPLFRELAAARPRDVNLQCALLRARGHVPFYPIRDTGLSTFVHAEAERHRASGFDTLAAVIVQATTLAAICNEHASGTTIDFLKVDTEGTEHEVLSGGDWNRFRPRIVIVEATRPLSQEPTHAEWEPYLLANGYLFAYFDGLNRFYVSEEERPLLAAFDRPPNVFDNFVASSEHRLERRCETLERQLASALRSAEAWERWRTSLPGRLLARLPRR